MRKRLTALILLLCITFASCDIILPDHTVKCNHSDRTSDGLCDFCRERIEATANDTCVHTDSENDGLCDTCFKDVLIELDIYNVNDLHGKLDDGDNHIGVDELTTYLLNKKQSDTYSIFLSSGDMWKGSAESNLTYGKIVTDWMNELDFAAMTLGNHEFDWGEDFIEDNLDIAEFPFLAINVYERSTNSLVSYATPSVLIDKGVLQIGIIGAIGDCYSSIAASNVKDIYFKVGSELTTLVKNEADSLRARGADVIIYALHDGYGKTISGSSGYLSSQNLSSYYDSSLSNGYVDIVFEGHTHQKYIASDTYGVYHLQGGDESKGITHAEILCNIANGSVFTAEAEFIEAFEYENLEDHPIVDTLLEKYSEQLQKADEVLGNIGYYVDDTVIEQKVADLYFEVAMKEWGDKYDIALAGGFIRTRDPYNFYAGEVKYSDVVSVLPFDNRIVLCKISGYKLKTQFFENDSTDYYIAYGEYGESIKDSINTSATYYIVVDNYTSDYRYNGLTVVDYYSDNIFARDLMAEYIKNGGFSN